MVRRLGPLLCLMLIASACTLSRPLAQHAVSYNKTVEIAQNQMLLLNVVRAQQRMPMYFTSIGGITTSIGYTLDSGSLTLEDAASKTIEKAAAAMAGSDGSRKRTDLGSNSGTLKLPSVSYFDKPTVQINVLDDQEFMWGALTPVRPETVYFYWQQGWRSEMLIYLLVESIKLTKNADPSLCEHLKGDDRERVVKNDPDDPKEFGDFSKCVASFGDRCRVEPVQTVQALQGYVTTGAASVADLLKGAEKELVVTTSSSKPGSHETRIGRIETRLRLVCEKTGTTPDGQGQGAAKEGESTPEETARADTTGEVMLGSSRSSYPSSPPSTQQDSDADCDGDDAGDDAVDVDVVFRSPQGVLYYLGEIARAWGRTGGLDQVPKIRLDEGETGFRCSDESDESDAMCVPLFVLQNENPRCDGAILSVEYQGTTWFIPSGPDEAAGKDGAQSVRADFCNPGRSMQALALVSQLLALQKNTKERPGPALVRVVGQ